MNTQEREKLSKHVGHDVRVTDYRPGEAYDAEETGRFCLECEDCGGEIVLGDRVLVGTVDAVSVTNDDAG